MSDILSSSKIHVCSSLQADFTVIHDNGIEYSVGAPTIAADVFKFLLHSLNTLGEQREVLVGMYKFHSNSSMSKEYIQSTERKSSLHPAELKLVPSGIGGLEASFKVVYSYLATSQAWFMAVEPERDHNRDLIDAYAKKCQDLGALLARVQHRLEDHSSLFRFSHDMLP